MKKVCKIVLIFLIILNLYSIIFSVKAFDIWGDGQAFLDKGSGAQGVINSSDINAEFMNIIDFLWGIGLLMIFITTVVLGIKYMLVNPNEKSRIKQATTPYIIGVTIIFGALSIWRLVIEILEGSMLD